MLKKVIITGANGFIGQHLVEGALQHSMSVFAGVREGSVTHALQSTKANITFLDYENIDKLSQLLVEINPDYIIHNAGLTRTPDYNEFLKVNRDYLVNIVEAIRLSGIQLEKLLFISSLAAFGPADFQKEGIVTHDSSPHPVTNYGRSKLAAEMYLKAQTDIPYSIVRPTAVYGPGEKDLFSVFKLINQGINAMVGYNPQKLTFIYVKDLVDLILKATIAQNMHQSYFATDGNIYSALDFPNAIQKSLNKKVISIKLPVTLIKFIAYLSEKTALITGKFPTLYSERVHEIKARNWSCDTSNLQDDLGFKANYQLEKGIEETVVWYKNNNWF